MTRSETMFVLVMMIVTMAVGKPNTQMLRVKRDRKISRQTDVGLDRCITCLNQASFAIEVVQSLSRDRSLTGSCEIFCPAVVIKSKSDTNGALCDLACQAVGIKEFLRIVDTADLDPIRYCQVSRDCPIKDDGDAKIKTFSIIPASGPQGTTFGVDFSYVTINGTGPGELLIEVMTPDRIPYKLTFIVEGEGPGTFYEFVSVTAEPDPSCDPTYQPCEQWLAGIYNLTAKLCYGECGSKFPHSGIYDVGRGSFTITG